MMDELNIYVEECIIYVIKWEDHNDPTSNIFTIY